jgi:hypothetical protein
MLAVVRSYATWQGFTISQVVEVRRSEEIEGLPACTLKLEDGQSILAGIPSPRRAETVLLTRCGSCDGKGASVCPTCRGKKTVPVVDDDDTAHTFGELARRYTSRHASVLGLLSARSRERDCGECGGRGETGCPSCRASGLRFWLKVECLD